MNPRYTQVFPLNLEPQPLESTRLRLEPLEERHLEGLLPLFDPSIWKWYSVTVDSPEKMLAFLKRNLAETQAGKSLHYAIRNRETGELVGSTSYLNIDRPNRRVEIGSTWYAPQWQRTYVNTECKLTLLTHAFEKLKCISVLLQTDEYNQKSRQAIERIGAKYDGMLRGHRICDDGRIRDTVIYSILENEWPGVRARLEDRLPRN